MSPGEERTKTFEQARELSASVFPPVAYVPALTPERWQSGLSYLTRNQACPKGYRGFESHPLRHAPQSEATAKI